MSQRTFTPRRQSCTDEQGRFSMWAFMEDLVAQYNEATPAQRAAFARRAERFAHANPAFQELIEANPCS